MRRVALPVVPPHVEDSLTSLGESLPPLLGELCRWAGQHLTGVREARAANARAAGAALSQKVSTARATPPVWVASAAASNSVTG